MQHLTIDNDHATVVVQPIQHGCVVGQGLRGSELRKHAEREGLSEKAIERAVDAARILAMDKEKQALAMGLDEAWEVGEAEAEERRER